MPSTSPTYSIAEAATELGITERRVRQLIDEGRITPVEDGMGRQRLTKAQVNNELKRRGRVAVRSLPGHSESVRPEDPLVSRLDEQSELLRELIVAVRALANDRDAVGALASQVVALAEAQSDLRRAVVQA